MPSNDAAMRLDMDKFQDLMIRKRKVSAILTTIILAIYFGFILVLAFNKELFAVKIGAHITLWLPIGIGVILSAWVLTGIYVRWANNTYDRLVRDVRNSMR